MFNTTKVYNTTNHPKTIEVKEHRAPTDESVKILREMEKEILDNIISMGKIEDNVFNVKWYIYPDRNSWDDVCRCVFTLNGKEYDFDFNLPGKFVETSRIIPTIKEKILERITNVLMDDLFKTCDKTLIDIYKPYRK